MYEGEGREGKVGRGRWLGGGSEVNYEGEGREGKVGRGW